MSVMSRPSFHFNYGIVSSVTYVKQIKYTFSLTTSPSSARVGHLSSKEHPMLKNIEEYLMIKCLLNLNSLKANERQKLISCKN